MKPKSTGTDTPLLSVEDTIKTAKNLYRIQETFRNNFHESVEIQTIMFFLEVASHEEPCDLSSVGQKLSVSKAAASRNFYRLSDGKSGTGGLDLVKSQVDYMDRRRVLLELTPKGRSLIDKLHKEVMR